MKANALVGSILLLNLVLSLMSTLVQATDYRKVTAEDVSKYIKNGNVYDGNFSGVMFTNSTNFSGVTFTNFANFSWGNVY